ncbi:MAG: uroporphyrinogen decarboxylase family protein [Phycisphaerales bacterium]
MSFFIKNKIDFRAHNEEVARVWQAYYQGRAYRVPVSVVGSITNYLLNHHVNTKSWSFRDFFEDPETHIQAQLEYQKWQRFHWVCDRPMGLPEDGWCVNVDFQNSFDAGWAGCPLEYIPDQVPDTREILNEHKEKLYEFPKELPADHGLMKRVVEFQDYMIDSCKHREYEGRPVHVMQTTCGEGTDGPLDLAYKLRGADNLLVDMLTDQKYFHDLMTWVTDNLIRRMKRMRQRRWDKFPESLDKDKFKQAKFYFADDAIALISTKQYREYVYPYHKRLVDEFCDGSVDIHLCGDATRHFSFLANHLNVRSFDTGFPVDHGRLREELGMDVEIKGGPTVMVIKDGTAEDIRQQVKRICNSGVMAGGKFVMIAANNVAPRTPVENIRTLYEASISFGGIRNDEPA